MPRPPEASELSECIKIAPGSGVPWYYRSGSLLIAFLLVGPVMLPLVWLHPRMSRGRKTAYTALALAATTLIIWANYKFVAEIFKYYEFVFNV